MMWQTIKLSYVTTFAANTANDFPHWAAYLIIFVSLFAYFLVAIWAVTRNRNMLELKERLLRPKDEYYSARDSMGWLSMGFSSFASIAGVWIISAPSETALFTGYIGVVGYALSCVIPWFVLMVVGPILKNSLSGRGLTVV
eukprot:Trichotokara_eunicae@DN7668_c0_g1_i1.p1